MDILKWDSEKDYIVTDASVLLKHNETFCSESFFRWAYSINTAVGLFRRSKIEQIRCDEKIATKNGNTLTISYTVEKPTNLMLDNGDSCICVMENISVWGTKYFDSFMVFSSNITGAVFLIDSRGIIFELPCVSSVDKYRNEGVVEQNKRDGYFLINDALVYYRTPEQRAEFCEKSRANNSTALNREFNRFARANAHNSLGYLYLTAGSNKCGTFVTYFGEQGMQYELVPNLLCDDDTVNIRIPLDEVNASRRDVQFLCAKYNNTYSIYGIPFDVVGGGFEFPLKWRQKQRELRFFLPREKEAMVYSVVDTLRSACETDDDYEVYKKTISKVLKLFEKGSTRPEYNEFTQILLPYAPKWEDGGAFLKSKQRYKQAMVSYESEVMREMVAKGIKINRWKNESHLFLLVVSEYPDAIYQYHCDWLGLQSWDIYIPSLRIGIEYQGEQHYRPIEFFGGMVDFQETQARDAKKADLCLKNGVKLIHWKYNEIINKSNLQKKISALNPLAPNEPPLGRK